VEALLKTSFRGIAKVFPYTFRMHNTNRGGPAGRGGDAVIEVDSLVKEYRVYDKPEGLLASVTGLFHRTSRLVEALRGAPDLPYFDASVTAVNCHHNYVAREHHYGKDVLVTRKGAVRAREGDLGIIPGSRFHVFE
jgi:hypothetical protein